MAASRRPDRVILHVLIILLIGLTPILGGAAESSTDIDQKLVELTRIQNAMDSLSREIIETRDRMSQPEGQGREQLLESHLDSLQRKLFSLEGNFNDLASEISLDTLGQAADEDFNWNRELKIILSPLIRELQQATSRPREIEKYRSAIETQNQQLERIDEAMGRINTLMNNPGCPPRLRERLSRTLAAWKNRRSEVETQRSIATLQLDKISGHDEPFTRTLQKIPKMFFKSHGNNLIMALLAFFLTAFILFRFHGVIVRATRRRRLESPFYIRAFDLGYRIAAMGLSLGVLLGVLYLLSDWVLLSLLLVFMIGLVWTSKETLPRVWDQCRLILNLGPVREGELIVYNGIPYKVLSINVFTLIYNPDIPNSRIRIPVADLLSLRSRPASATEPWFPSRIGDWVLLGDENPMKVLTQTPETVVVEKIGGARISYPAADYLSAAPMNLSSGFRIKVPFGLDYALQPIVTDSVPGILEKGVEEHLTASGFMDRIIRVRAEFKQAAASSLDIELLVDVAGDGARHYARLNRLIQAACVDVCNARKWSIPFNQLTVHLPAPEHS
ncbi:hypothetical protein JCM14469_21930 [Desulfatiferula olefinivorans]